MMVNSLDAVKKGNHQSDHSLHETHTIHKYMIDHKRYSNFNHTCIMNACSTPASVQTESAQMSSHLPLLMVHGMCVKNSVLPVV